MKRIEIGPDKILASKEIDLVANDNSVKVAISQKGIKAIGKSRKAVEKLVSKKERVYGVTTGFGKFKDVFLKDEKDIIDLQKNLIRSHSAGVGIPLSPNIVRAIILARLNSLVQGYSGVRLELLDAGLGLLNKNVMPLVPSKGSVGASGDLAPLAHIGLILIGEGEAWYKGRRMPSRRALKSAGLSPIEFSAKEGLAWTNGTAFMTGIGSLVAESAKRLVNVSDIACALTLESVAGVSDAFHSRIHNLRPHSGQIKSAKNIRGLVRNSKLIDSFSERVQDSYSLRCAPQVHGAVRDALDYVRGVIECELNSVNDNPLIFSTKPYCISGGNFHGQPVSLSLDFLRVALASLANISERRTAKLVDASTNEGLPMFLISEALRGLHNGLMISQYTAATLVSENKILAHPASVDTIPTSANQEDHVSMGATSALKTLEVIENVENVLAIELLTSAQAVEFRGPSKLGQGTKTAYRLIRKKVSPLTKDRVLSGDISALVNLLNDSRFYGLIKT